MENFLKSGQKGQKGQNGQREYRIGYPLSLSLGS